ncbi:MAG TPA: aminoacyl-tRNA hydrolase [Acidobacteriaceae bacterium]|nr:aminoacyl-tRNA hydrolase [Acidobacteriaceae bacterium]
MKLIVGLGNPGIEYQFTPHNAGFLAVDRIAERSGVQLTNRRCKALTAMARVAGQEVILAKPETFMNLSGNSVGALLNEYELNERTDLIVLYDDLALAMGTIRIRERGSSGGHNGVKSISGVLGTEDWIRIRLGVGKQTLEGEPVNAGGKDYLLSPMRKQELAVMDEVLDRAAQAAEVILSKGVLAAMSEFNGMSKDKPE